MSNLGRRQRKANRFLPAYVSRFTDQHGRDRLRFRRKGFPSGYFKAALGTEAFREEYRAFNNPEAPVAAARAAHDARIEPGSIADLRRQYYAVPVRLGPTETTQRKIRSVLDRGFFDGRETWPVAGIRFDHLDAMIADRRKPFFNEETKRKEGGDQAAKKLRKELVRLFDFAEKIKMVPATPMKHVAKVKIAPADRSPGYYPWSEDDIAKYRERWALGTKQRLAMELLLWTDQRKVDTIHLGPQHVKGRHFVVRQSKTGKTLKLLIADQLRAAIDAMPGSDALCFILTEYGKPFSVKGFGGWFRDQCDAAGLPRCTAHGLRKAMMRRMAELEMSNSSMKSVSGHSKDEEVSRYVESANQERLATAAITRVSEWERSNPDPTLDVRTA